jgi:hypothetical protein
MASSPQASLRSVAVSRAATLVNVGSHSDREAKAMVVTWQRIALSALVLLVAIGAVSYAAMGDWWRASAAILPLFALVYIVRRRLAGSPTHRSTWPRSRMGAVAIPGILAVILMAIAVDALPEDPVPALISGAAFAGCVIVALLPIIRRQ